MKTAMKRLLSFLLVAMMLVSIVPMAASAVGELVEAQIKCGENTSEVPITEEMGNVNDVLTAWALGEDWTQEYNFVNAIVDDSEETTAPENITVRGAGSVIINISEKSADKGTEEVGNNDADISVKVTFGTCKPDPIQTSDFNSIGSEFTKTVSQGSTVSDLLQALRADVPDDYVITDRVYAYGNTTPLSGSDVLATTEETTGYAVVLDAKATWTITVKLDNMEKSATIKLEAGTEPGITNQTVVDLKNELASQLSKDMVAKWADKLTISGTTATLTGTSQAAEPEPTTEPTTDAKKDEYTVTFIDEKDNDKVVKTVTTKDQKLSTAPDGPDHNGYIFDRWDTAPEGKGYEKAYSKGMDITKDTTFYARYKKADEENTDKKSTLTVIAKRYVDGTEKNEKIIAEYTLDKGDNVYDVLKNYQAKINSAINALGWDGEWVDGKFYENDNGQDEITNLDEMDGNRYVYVMVGEGTPIKVQLYMHLSYSKEPEYIINMYGYEAKDVLKAADINKALKNKWEDRKYNWTGMYSNSDWMDILGGKDDVTAQASYHISKYKDDDGDRTVQVHIHAVRTSANNSDNPKTGDTILMAVTVLGLSATALAAAYFFNKKKKAM